MTHKTLARNAEDVLSYLEKKAEDELSYLESVGAEYFSTAQLIRLKGQWETKHQLFEYTQRWLIRIAAISPVWLAAWLGLNLLDVKWLSFACLACFPASFMVFFVGLYFMRNYFKGKGHLDFVGAMIDLELQKRRYLS